MVVSSRGGRRVTSRALIGGPRHSPPTKRPVSVSCSPAGAYVLQVSFQGFTPAHEEDVRIGAGATIERTAILEPAGPAASIVVEGTGSRHRSARPGVRHPLRVRGLSIQFPRGDRACSTRSEPRRAFRRRRRRAARVTTVSAFGSGTNENQFLFDGTNFTCPCNGVARSEPGVDFIQEVQVQSVGASAEFGNMQGAVINVVTRQGSDRFLLRRVVLRAAGGADQPAGAARRSGPSRQAERLRARQIPRPDDEPRRSRRARSVVVLRGLPVSAGLRQPTWHRSDVSEDLRAEQDLREAHLAAGARPAVAAKLSRRVWVNPMPPTFVTPFEAPRRSDAHRCRRSLSAT